ncbi:disease resistance protein RGA1 [Canna indica]|uniref:Disease resistance protein RGA1 n=1 Tax=Canna indica TaxID=4628 RepID=A0AAQ3KVT0_9LILI|nr:disease resistance protein RGA1 [Canna indica]
MVMLRTLGWFTEILIGSLFAKLCDHAVHQLWVQQGLHQVDDLMIPDVVRSTSPSPLNIPINPNSIRSAEELLVQLKSTVSDADDLLCEFQRQVLGRRRKKRRSSLYALMILGQLFMSRRPDTLDDQELVRKMREIQRRLDDLAEAVDQVMSSSSSSTSRGGSAGHFSVESREFALERGRKMKKELTTMGPSVDESEMVIAIAAREAKMTVSIIGLVMTYICVWCWMFAKSQRICLIPKSLLDYLE